MLSLAVAGFSQSKGEWRARLRATAVLPSASASISAINGSVDISENVIPELDFTYFLARNFSTNLILGTSRHNLKATGTALGNVDLGKVWLLPPTVTFLYHLPVGNRFLPYAGAGANYTIFYGVKNGTAIAKTDYKNNLGFAAQIGGDMDLTERLFINLDIKRIWLKTYATATTIPAVAEGATVVAKTKINPWLLSLGVGIKF